MLFFGFDIPIIIAFVITALLAFAYHELAHAIVADRLGDPTPRSFGRISLNPLVHLDRLGTIMLLLFGFGWASTPVNPYRLRGNPRRSMALVSVAGPAANLIMATLFGLPLQLGLVSFAPSGDILPTPYVVLVVGVQINLLLMAFNLIPIPPLDGFTILIGILPPELAYRLEPLRQYGSNILFLLIAVSYILPISLFGLFITPVIDFFFPILTGL